MQKQVERHDFAGALKRFNESISENSDHSTAWSAWFIPDETVVAIRASLTMAMQQAERPVVDVEALKKIKQYHHDGYYLSDDDHGWNECLDHLQEKGLFR